MSRLDEALKLLDVVAANPSSPSETAMADALRLVLYYLSAAEPTHPEAPRAELGLPEGVRGKLEQAVDQLTGLQLTVPTVTFRCAETARNLIREALASTPEVEPVASPYDHRACGAGGGDEDDTWEETARQHARNEQYYHGLLVEVGRVLGPEAFTADDGSVQADVLCAKVPELVRRRLGRGEPVASAGADPFEAGYDPKRAAASTEKALRARITELEARLAERDRERTELIELRDSVNGANRNAKAALADRDSARERVRELEAEREHWLGETTRLYEAFRPENSPKNAREAKQVLVGLRGDLAERGVKLAAALTELAAWRATEADGRKAATYARKASEYYDPGVRQAAERYLAANTGKAER